MSNTIYFYGMKHVPYGCFSNFSNYPFELDGHVWKTSEHYFQAQKFINDQKSFDEVRNAKSALMAARLGRSRKRPLRPDWESVKIDLMRKALYAKFKSNEQIKQVLLSTKDAKIVENSPRDYFWGCGSNKKGLNKLGLLLMETRDKLRKELKQ